MITRRDFLKYSLGAAALAGPLASLELFKPSKLLASTDKNKVRWGFLVDTYKCVGCGFCVKACKKENEVPYDASVSRTWVERYVRMKDGTITPVNEALGNVLADSPMAGRDGFTRDNPMGMKINKDDIQKAFFVPKLCNQCENPPCVQVCPVGATYQTADGVVLVDRTWCIGCGYCIMACPYGVRFFHPVYKTAEKCTFCYHRISKGLKSACVQACPFGARKIGNINDPNDEVGRIIRTERVSVLKDEYGTKPQVYYIGLSKEVR